MKNAFEAEYQQDLKIRTAFYAAKEVEDQEGVDASRAAMRQLSKSITEKGPVYNRISNAYIISRRNGNELLDFSEVIWDDQVAELIACMRKNGIERFTFSSGWSSAVETAWLFLQSGCKLEGMTMINGEEILFGDGKREHNPAYIFSIN